MWLKDCWEWKKIVFIIGCVICSDKDNISGESILVILEGGV